MYYYMQSNAMSVDTSGESGEQLEQQRRHVSIFVPTLKSTCNVNNNNSNNPTIRSTEPISFLFIKIDSCSTTSQFYILTAGIIVFYLLYGFFQELIFRLQGFHAHGWYLTLIQFGFYTIFGKLEWWLRKIDKKRIPWCTYFMLAFFTLMTMGLSNTSVGYLNYPTQVMFKCCKLIPVLIGSIIIQGKKIKLVDFAAAGCMSIGLIFFTLADSKLSPSFNHIGITMISLALVADAVIGNIQEKAMKTYQASNVEVVLYSYLIGFCYLLAGAVIFGELGSAFQFCAKHPVETYGYGAIFSVTGYFGIHLVLSLIKVSGVFVAVTVTTFRKALSIVISFALFSKPFTIQYLWSGTLVVLGIYLNIAAKVDVNIFWNGIINFYHYLMQYYKRCRSYTKISYV